MIPILVTSGKGGVGKSTCAINLAVNIAERGIRVSFLDADLMAPNDHLFFDIKPDQIREEGRMLIPIRIHPNLEFMGLGIFVPRGTGIALSYEKTSDFITTLLRFVKWSGDYLVIDTPPSSLDVNVKLLKELKGRARAIIVGEPHPFAVEDNLRMLDLLRFFDIDVRAIVLNKYNLYREELAKEVEKEYEATGIPIVRIPWDPRLQQQTVPELFNELVELVIG